MVQGPCDAEWENGVHPFLQGVSQKMSECFQLYNYSKRKDTKMIEDMMQEFFQKWAWVAIEE